MIFKNSIFILNLISPLYLVYYRLFILVFNNFEIFLEDYYFKNQIGYKYNKSDMDGFISRIN